MAYTKTVWEDEVLSGAERFEILDNAGAAVDAWADLAECQIRLATSVTTAGTALDATHLNNIEDGIEDLATGAARSVKGVAGDAAGDVDDIVAGTDGHVLRRSGTGIGFGTVDSGGIANGSIDTAHIADAQVTPAKTSFLDASYSSMKLYPGSFDIDGNEWFLPDGWTVAKLSTGKYRITHNLGTIYHSIVMLGGGVYWARDGYYANYIDMNAYNKDGNLNNSWGDFIIFTYGS
jgi:hypothetical protein